MSEGSKGGSFFSQLIPTPSIDIIKFWQGIVELSVRIALIVSSLSLSLKFSLPFTSIILMFFSLPPSPVSPSFSLSPLLAVSANPVFSMCSCGGPGWSNH